MKPDPRRTHICSGAELLTALRLLVLSYAVGTLLKIADRRFVSRLGPLALLLSLSTAVGCLDGNEPIRDFAVEERNTLTERFATAGEPLTMRFGFEKDTVVQVRAWSVGELVGINAKLTDPDGHVVWTGFSPGTEIRIDGYRVKTSGEFVFEATWVTGDGVAGYRYEVLESAKAVVTDSPIAELPVARSGHTATRLSDGRVLVTGGHQYGSGMSAGRLTPLATAEIIDPDKGTVEVVGLMAAPRAYHGAQLITTGSDTLVNKVLIAGGLGEKGDALVTTELFDPETGTFTTGPTLPGPRAYLQTLFITGTGTFIDDKIVLYGGERTRGGAQLDFGECLYSEVDQNPKAMWYFDPQTGSMSLFKDLKWGRLFPTATIMADGRILFAGGGIDKQPSAPGCKQTGSNKCCCAAQVPLCTEFTNCVDGVCDFVNYTRKDGATDILEIYDTETAQMLELDHVKLKRARAGHSATLTPGNQVIFAGGATAVRRSFAPSEIGLVEFPKSISTVEIFDPVTDEVRVIRHLAVPREHHRAVSLAGGRIALVGGLTAVPGGVAPVNLVEIYEPSLRRFVASDSLTAATALPGVVALDGLRVLFVGGEGSGGPSNQARLLSLEL